MSSAPDSGSSASPPGPSRFATTHWSLVAAAAEGGSAESRAALETLCQAYWYPLYAFMRRQGRDAEAARDLTQGFFLELLEKDRLPLARSERGRFRSFLLAAARNYLANQARDARAAKRGGGQQLLSLDFTTGEARYCQEPADEETPERIFERRWAVAVTQAALAALQADYAARGKARLFELLVPHLNGSSDQPQEQLAAELDMNVGAVKTALHRLRVRCRELLRAEIARTVGDEREIDDEMQQLFRAL